MPVGGIMIELIYISKASKRFSQDELIEMLSVFRKNNENNDITGLFLYDGLGTFIQVLEGKADTVRSLLNKIRKDKRHSRINVLGDRDILQRSFSNWSMGFKRLDDSFTQNLHGYSNFLEESDRTHYLSQHPSFALELLEYFKNNNQLNLNGE